MSAPRVLIVEDGRAVRATLRRRIESELGFEAVTAGSLAETEEIVSSGDASFFLAILDLGLPDAQQGEVVDFALENRIPSVVFSSRFDEALRTRLLEKNVIDYVLKSGHGVDDLVYLVERLHKNREVEILVLDDSEAALAHMARLLELYMFTVHLVKNARRAPAALEEHPNISLVITDYEMPGMNGVELTKTLRRKYDRDALPVIGVSAQTQRNLSVRFLKSGANDYLNKPFRREELYCRVASVLESAERIRKLRELDEMKNKFIGMAAHDLRTPINGVTGLSRLLLDGDCGPLNPEQEDFVGHIHTSADRMRGLVDNILDLSKIESGRLELNVKPADLEALVRERVRLAAPVAAKKDMAIHLDLGAVGVFAFDANLTAQVLDNLVGNAVKFSPPGKDIAVRLEKDRGRAVVRVADQGPGVRPDERDRLFHSFQKLSARPTAGEPSTGLGLAICKNIVTAHGGDIGLTPEFGPGAEFFFSLPMEG